MFARRNRSWLPSSCLGCPEEIGIGSGDFFTAGFQWLSFCTLPVMAGFENLNLEHHLGAIRSDVTDLRAKSRDIKAQLTVIRGYIADQNTEPNLLNARFAAAELKN